LRPTSVVTVLVALASSTVGLPGRLLPDYRRHHATARAAASPSGTSPAAGAPGRV
jgi:hypothetical protein